MINFERFKLDNGLRVLVHTDNTTQVVALNIIYNVGSRDEDSERTGFAHLFEHLMFGGSVNIPKFDEPLQRVGGDNNAFTNNDYTNYYITIPINNIETAFWLESDRMLSLAFSEKSLDVQRNVVIEEFKQRYLSQPYGDAWQLLRPLAYKVHPYQWNTIGKDISHIEEAKMEDVKAFFETHYAPNNAIMVVSGNVTTEEIRVLSEKWFGSISAKAIKEKKLEKEPEQKEARSLTISRKVPYDALYITFHTCNRKDKNYYATDLLSDILSNGDSSRLYQRLVKEKQYFSDINAYITGSIDEGLFVVSGYLMEGITMELAESAIYEELEKLKEEQVSFREIDKVKNKVVSSLAFAEVNVLEKSMRLAYFELLGDGALINTELDKYQAVTAEQIQDIARTIFLKTNSSTLYYHRENESDAN